MVKQFGGGVGPIEQLFGALLVAAPALTVTSIFSDDLYQGLPTIKSAATLLYLGVVGSFFRVPVLFQVGAEAGCDVGRVDPTYHPGTGDADR